MPKQIYLVVKDTQSKKIHPDEIYGAYQSALDAEMEVKQRNRVDAPTYGKWTVIAVDEKEVNMEDRKLTRTSCL